MYDAELKNSEQSYPVKALLTELHQAIFNGNPDAFQRNLQRSYLTLLSDLLKNKEQNLSDIKPLVRAELAWLKAHMLTNKEQFLQGHYLDLNHRINEALKQG